MSRAVVYERNGGPEVLRLVEREEQQAAPSEVRVKVVTAGLNPVDWKIFTGFAPHYKTELPAGAGNDFAGVIDQVGAEVTGWSVGDEVFGGARHRAVAEHIVVDPGTLHRKPDQLRWEQAGSLDIAGRTAAAVVASVGLTADDTVLISAAAGGVGVIVSQLAVRIGATAIGTASEANHEFLRSLGVIPVTYGGDLVERLRQAAPQPITAVLDQHGRDTLDAAIELRVSPDRVNTIADKPYGSEHGFKIAGGNEAEPGDLDEIARLVADGELQLPIEAEYPIDKAREAYERLMAGHLRGKIVLRIG
ncbi:NADP-dependent oxidoreductase [Okibacterium endophyticum]